MTDPTRGRPMPIIPRHLAGPGPSSSVAMLTLTESIRRRIEQAGAACPWCHQPIGAGGYRELAKAMGVPHSTLWRFMGGNVVSSTTLDKIVAWLDAGAVRV